VPVLVSVIVGLPRDVAWEGRTVHTGVWKQPVAGPQMVRRLNIDGDGQGDTAGHGGEQRAVLVYQLESYRHWEQHFGRRDLPYGQFGENLTVDGLPDDEVCIGDRYRIGEAEFEVTQPRVTCYRVGLRFGEPRGDFVLDGDRAPVVLLSAGIGVTPLVAMLHELVAQRSARPVWWVHAARGPAERPLAAEAHRLLAELANTREEVFYTAASEEECRRDGARPGRPTAAELARLAIPADAHAYLCGPAAFMADMREALTDLGLDGAHVHSELFTALASITPGIATSPRVAPHQPPGPTGPGPLVTFARSGISTPFTTAWRPVLDLAEACDVNTRWSCRTGVCHTCTTGLLSGEVAYDPAPLEPPGPGEVLVCCTRPTTDVVLDM
jgi:ferredoxin-NADP reductase